MAGQVLKKRRLANTRRRMSPKQIRFFGTKRQKAALKGRRRHNQSSGGGSTIHKLEHAAERAIDSIESAAESAIGAITGRTGNRGRRNNVGEILTVLPANPGRRKSMAATKRRSSNRRRGRASNRGRRAVARKSHRARNSPRVVVRYRNRKSNRKYSRRRHNIGGGALGGDLKKVAATLGGALLTNLISGFLPTTFLSGWTGILATGAVALVAGSIGGKVLGDKQLGTWITVGGLMIAGLQVVQTLMPTLSMPFTLAPGGQSGMGLITSSNFYVPQVNQPGSMASFYLPANVPPAVVQVPAGTGSPGMGQYRNMRRVGRLR